MSKIERWLVLPDMHIREEHGRLAGLDRKTFKAVMKYASRQEWDGVVQLGDFLDFNCISSHNAGALRKVEGETLAGDYRQGNLVLDQLQALNPKKFVILEGNHDERVERYIDANPRLAGTVEVAKQLRLKDRGIKWVRYASRGEVFTKGKLMFIHGIYTNDAHAKKHVLAYGGNVMYGHLHDCQQHSISTIKDNSTTMAQSIGCLCDYRQEYMKGRPNKWQQAFAEVFFRPDGFFNYYVTMIFNHGFVGLDREVYKG